jgi:hypothetical protein
MTNKDLFIYLTTIKTPCNNIMNQSQAHTSNYVDFSISPSPEGGEGIGLAKNLKEMDCFIDGKLESMVIDELKLPHNRFFNTLEFVLKPSLPYAVINPTITDLGNSQANLSFEVLYCGKVIAIPLLRFSDVFQQNRFITILGNTDVIQITEKSVPNYIVNHQSTCIRFCPHNLDDHCVCTPKHNCVQHCPRNQQFC